MTPLDYESKLTESYYSNNFEPNYHLRFSRSGEGWRVDLVKFKDRGFWLKISKEFAYGSSMISAVKNLRELLQSKRP